MRVMIVLAAAGIAFYAFLNLKYLAWNLVRFRQWKGTSAYEGLSSSNAETQVLAMPLALAMSVNVCFILGMVFVPGLWSVVEYLFPLALAAFLAIGFMAFRMIGRFMGRVLAFGGFSCVANNSFAQALPAFALAMIGVGLAAPAGLSATPLVAGTGASPFDLLSHRFGPDRGHRPGSGHSLPGGERGQYRDRPDPLGLHPAADDHRHPVPAPESRPGRAFRAVRRRRGPVDDAVAVPLGPVAFRHADGRLSCRAWATSRGSFSVPTRRLAPTPWSVRAWPWR